MSPRYSKPKLPLLSGPSAPGYFSMLITHDADNVPMLEEEIAWLNRAAESYRAERPKLRRLLRRALEELEDAFGPRSAQSEEETAFLVELHDALKPRRKA